MLYVVQILNNCFPAKHGSWKLWIYINFLMFALILNLNKHEPSYTAWRNSKSPAFQLQYIWQPLIQCVRCRLSICSHFGWVWQIISEWYARPWDGNGCRSKWRKVSDFKAVSLSCSYLRDLMNTDIAPLLVDTLQSVLFCARFTIELCCLWRWKCRKVSDFQQRCHHLEINECSVE